MMQKPFEDAAFKMEKDQISDLVKSPFGYHIIKVEDIKEESTKELEAVRKQISDILINNESMDLANEKGLSLIDQMPYDIDLVEYGRQLGLEVVSTGFFAPYEPIPVIGGDDKLKESIFSFQKGETSELLEFDNNFYIIQVQDKHNKTKQAGPDQGHARA